MAGKCGEINIYFVKKNHEDSDETVSDDMKRAYSNAADWSLKPKWIDENQCSLIDCNIKGNVFVFEKFVGNFFSNFVISHKYSRVIGPKCLLTCFAELVAIPNTMSPVYNMAMNGLIISASIKQMETKKTVKELVGFMGGRYTDALTTSTTHLVVLSVLSEKYLRAKENGIRVMKFDWVEDVWKKNFENCIQATNDDIINKYKCPIFYNLTITASLLNAEEKQKIKKIIDDGGGTYTSELQMNVTNILIIPFGRGEKYKFATRWKIICLNPLWIKECLKKGYAVCYEKYIVLPENKCSTPVQSMRNMNLVNFLDSNDSEISVIPSAYGITIIGESENLDSQYNTLPTKSKNDANIFKTPVKNSTADDYSKDPDALSYQKILERIQITDLKKCPHLLDGCKVYLTGFSASEEEKLRRILNYGGAMRFTELNESVTHIIIGNPNENELQNLKWISNKPHIVKLEWLAMSIAKGCLEVESNCAYLNENKELSDHHASKSIQQPSPLSKKGMQMLNPVKNIPVSTHPLIGVDHILIEKYSHSHDLALESRLATKTNVVENMPMQKEAAASNVLDKKLFTGLRFSIVGHSSSVTEDIRDTILEFGGSVVSRPRSIVDYSIVPFANITSKIISDKIVTSIWIEECLSERRIVETKYYHKPVNVPDHLNAVPLNNCVITFSSYNIHERQYLENVAAFLGAKCQDVLSKKENMEKNIVRTTHLICSCAQGVKYKAAKKWNLPVIKETWLLECFAHTAMLSIDDFLLDEGLNVLNEPSSPSKELTKVKYRVNPSLNADFNKYSDTTNLTPSSSSKISSKSGVKSNNVERIIVATPSITEAVRKSASKIAENEKQNQKVGTSSKSNWPTGLLLEINACASSSLKRKLGSQIANVDQVSRFDSPKKKLIRYDNHSSSPYEEVGWQDTLTDLSNIHSGNPMNINKNNSHVGIENGRDDINSKNERDNEKCILQTDAAGGENILSQSNKDRDKTKFQLNQDNTALPSLSKFVPCKEVTDFKNKTVLTKNFLISMSNIEKKSQYENVIKSLGGHVFSSFPVDCAESEKATHIVIDELKKTEKLLCSIASGLWVLHPSYIDRCLENQTFVSEKDYEWGNPLNQKFFTNSAKDHVLIANAAYRWRKIIENEGSSKKPFVGMKAVIIGSPSDIQSLTRVVKSGGGNVLQSYDILNCTHCLLKSVKIDNIPVSLKRLAERKIHCLTAVYLSDFLMYNPPPDIKKFYHDKYKRLLK